MPNRTLHDRIVVNPEILAGKPIVSDTRISMQLVLEWLGRDLDIDALLLNYPRLTRDDVRACLHYAAALVSGEDVFPASVAAVNAAETARIA